MNKKKILYGVAVATALLGKMKKKEMGEYLEKYDETDIQIIKELQPILMDFGLSNQEIEVKIEGVWEKYYVD